MMHASLAKKDSFHQMLFVSMIVHCCLFSTLFVFKFKKSTFIIEEESGMNVVWSELVMAPPKTDENKLPGPILKPLAKKTVKSDESDPLSRSLKKPDNSSSKTKDNASKKLQSAIDALDLEEDVRPTPKLDNFASNENTEKKGLPSGPSGGGSLMGNPQFSRYKQQIEDHIFQNFYWLNKSDAFKTPISFYIDEQGNILNPKISKSSGNISFDNAALRAVKKSNPLPSPPEEIAKRLSKEEFIVNLSPQS